MAGRTIPPEVAQVAEVQKNMQTDVENLQKRVGTNENFASTFKEAAAGQKSIDEAIAGTIIKLLEKNSDAQKAVTSLVKNIDNRSRNQQLGVLGKIGLWIVSLVITAGVTAWITVSVTNANQQKQPSSTSAIK